MMPHWNMTERTLADLDNHLPEVVVIAIGAVEPHNWHLPLGMDWMQATHVSQAVCQRAHEAGASVVWLPAIPYGVDCNLMDFPMAIHVSQNTLDAMVKDIVVSLRHYGIKKIVLINSHGGNDFKPLIRQLQCDVDVHVFSCNWWTVGRDRYNEIFEKPDDHAGEMETSVGLALWPELIDLNRAGSGTTRPFRMEALEKGWLSTSRKFSQLNDHCAAGDPAAATAEKGQKYLDLVIGRIAQFLVELSDAEIDEGFPHCMEEE